MSDGNRENTTASVQIEEIKCTIRSLPFAGPHVNTGEYLNT
jgi:hypothetical protein